jgi:hypothetical protein
MCFFFVVCQWLGQHHTGPCAVFQVINLLLRSLVRGNLSQSHPCVQERITTWENIRRSWHAALRNKSDTQSNKNMWVDDTNWGDVACLLDATICMFYAEEWHITSGNVVDTELLWRTRGSTTIWTNAGASFPLSTNTARRCIFFRLLDGHYELLRPRFPVPSDCLWGVVGQSVLPVRETGWHIVDRDYLGPASVFPVSH